MKDVFQLKDIEKIAPKTKGITPMSVKDVLQSLVDDNMVDCERVGTSNYYWAFPSKALNTCKHKLEELQAQISEAKQRKVSVQAAVEKATVGREDTKERGALLTELQALKEERARLQAELEKYRECDPEVIEDMSKYHRGHRYWTCLSCLLILLVWNGAQSADAAGFTSSAVMCVYNTHVVMTRLGKR
ncbi:meiotic nuclear division protein 1 homolog isoform 3-T3 [Spinachia spinachia]